jgi:hypothetical protein
LFGFRYVSKFINWIVDMDAWLYLAIKFGSLIPRNVHRYFAPKEIQIMYETSFHNKTLKGISHARGTRGRGQI